MKKALTLFSLFALIVSPLALGMPNFAYACDTLETVTVDGITYTRVHSTLDPCPTAAAAPTPSPSPTPAPTPAPKPKLPGLVLPASTGPATTGGSSSGSGKSSNLGVAQQVGSCGDPQSGGALSEAFGSFVNDIGNRVGSEAWNSVLDGLNRSGPIGGVISDAFRYGASEAITNIGQQGSQYAGNYVSSQIQGAFGDSRLGQAAGRIVGNAAGRVVQNVGQNVVSNIAGQFGVGQSGGIGGAVNNFFGGASGGGNIVSGVTGLLGGSGDNVPVAEKKLQEIADQTKTIVDETKTLTTQLNEKSAIIVRRECVTKQAAAALVNQQIQKNAEQTLRETAPLAVTDFTKLRQDARQSAAEQFINGITGTNKERLQRDLTERETQKNDPVQPDCGDQSNPIMRMWLTAIHDESCTYSGQVADNIGKLEAAKQSAETQASEIVAQGGGVRSAGTCEGRPDATFEECQGPSDHWKANVPAKIVQEQLSDALKAPQQRLINTHDTGEIINDAFNDLLSEVFSTVGDEISGGIRGLFDRNGSRRSSNNSSVGIISGTTDTTSGTGSYFDQLNGSTLTPSDHSDLLSQNISNAASIESAYRTTLETMVANLQVVSNIFSGIYSCYQTLSTGTPTTITQQEALNRAATASTTVSAIFTTQINDRRAEIETSVTTASQLTILTNQAAATTDPGDLAALASAYQTLVDAHRTHTTADLQALVNDMNADADALQVIGEDANQQLTACHAIH